MGTAAQNEESTRSNETEHFKTASVTLKELYHLFKLKRQLLGKSEEFYDRETWQSPAPPGDHSRPRAGDRAAFLPRNHNLRLSTTETSNKFNLRDRLQST